MQVTVAKLAGFCFGVNRAVTTVEELVNKGQKVCTLGPIIHNKQLVSALEKQGVRTVEKPEDVKPDEVLVIRSHGVPKAVEERAEQCCSKVYNATCPFVAKIHGIVAEASRSGRTVLIAGDPEHSEVLGIRGHCEGPSFVFSTEEELVKLLKNNQMQENSAVTMVAQTTFHAE